MCVANVAWEADISWRGRAHGQGILVPEATPRDGSRRVPSLLARTAWAALLQRRAAQRYVTRYEQNHAAPENPSISGDDYEEYDGVSIMWFRSVEDMQAMFADPAFAPVLEDGERFLDRTATKQIVTFAEELFALGAGQP